MLANTTAVIILQHINVLNQRIVHLTLTQCYMSLLSQLKKNGFQGFPLICSLFNLHIRHSFKYLRCIRNGERHGMVPDLTFIECLSIVGLFSELSLQYSPTPTILQLIRIGQKYYMFN